MINSNGNHWKWLERDPKSSLRQLSIKGRRIRALTLYSLTHGEEALTPEQAAATYDLPIDAVDEAIAYCRSDPEEIREDLNDDNQLHAGPAASPWRRVS